MKKYLLCCLILVYYPAWGFGATGHRIIAAIAEQHLSPKTKQGIDELIAPQHLVHIANWADEIRSDPQWKHSGPWHYINIPKGKNLNQAQRSHRGDIIERLDYYIKQLSEANSPEQRQQALYFITHLVGDLHNPLHVGYLDDRGGNTIKLRFMGKSTNLHQIWDSGLIRYSELSYSEYVQRLDIHPATYYQQWQGQTIEQWLIDSRNQLDAIYHYSGSTLGINYYDQQRPILEQQLLKAGIRLAELLNKHFE